MTPSSALWTVGHLTVDDVISWNGSVHFRSAGGAALYAAIGGSLVGASARVATRLGDGFPVIELERLRVFGVELVPTGAGEPCISQWVLYEEDGSRTYVLHPDSGSLAKMSPAPEDYQIPGDAAVHLAPMPVESQLAWCRAERGRHGVLTVDPHEDSCAEDAAEVLQMAAFVDAFLPSEIEATFLAGSDPIEAVRAFQAAGAPIAVVKLGDRGSIVGTADGVWHVPVVPVEVVDATGAGDGYCGAFAAALSAGLDGLEAARVATAVASMMVETPGAVVPTFQDVRREIAERARSIEPTLLIDVARA